MLQVYFSKVEPAWQCRAGVLASHRVFPAHPSIGDSPTGSQQPGTERVQTRAESPQLVNARRNQGRKSESMAHYEQRAVWFLGGHGEHEWTQLQWLEEAADGDCSKEVS